MYSSKLAHAIRSGVASLLFIGLCVSASAATVDSARDRETAAEKFVAQRLQLWQDRLNLKDWDIKIQMVRTDQLEPKTLGNINWDCDVKSAKISVLSSYDYKLPYHEMLNDMEFTVVHELVHLHLASLPRSDASRRVEEKAVNELAAALLRLAKH
uniref:SprT-like domain-containing protein n=1 Tax=Solibacter usitatus (strain Ellin6076) TaxID=234267 RepID=Q021L2_SOLUE